MRLMRTLLVVGTGAALAYFLDPVSGRERREQLKRMWGERMAGGMPGTPWPEPVPPPPAESGPTVVTPESARSRSTRQ